MNTLIIAAPIALFVIGVAVTYYRFRDKFSDLAAASDSKQSNTFWTVIALIYAVVIAGLYLVFYHHGL